MKLVIVESPTKCQTIKRYLGSEYEVVASKGHIRELAKNGKGGLGVDIENDFKPTYKISKEKYNVVNDLRKKARKASEVILATDPDREGEAIAWHLTEVLGLDPLKTKRLEFHEITRDSINDAIKNPRTINLNLVSSQEARRIIDRIIGFKLSKLLNNKIHSKSAGRVQSATLKIIADHEKEIANFKPEEYYKISVVAKFNDEDYELTLKRNKPISSLKEAEEILSAIGDELIVSEVKKDIKTKQSKPPFKTSTLEQAAYNSFKIGTKETQGIAQSLYEGIQIEGEHEGLITYMRTDSTLLSSTFIKRATNFINETFGEQYIGPNANLKKTSKNEKLPHEAIRPTSNHMTPEKVKPYLNRRQYQLYKLIYDRALGYLMAPKKEEVTTVTFKCSDDVSLTLEGTRLIFDGYTKLNKNDEDKTSKLLPLINVGDKFTLVSKKQEQKFTQPPAHYSEAKIVSIMEDVGIGRPSTYANTISILNNRKYVQDSQGILAITPQGDKTSHVLDKYFPDIVNAKYTAQMEEKLDDIEEGKETTLDVLKEFYYPFIEEFENASKRMYKDAGEKVGRQCPKCGHDLVYKDGKNGRFISCSDYPNCDYVESIKKELVYTGETCPVCGKPLVERIGLKNKKFVACSGYPDCKYIKGNENKISKTKQPLKLVGKKCPKCGKDLVFRKNKKGEEFIACSGFPKCRYTENIKQNGEEK